MSDLFKKILIATDGSKYSLEATSKALEIARFHGAKVFALYVIDTRALITANGMPTPGNMYQVLEDEGKRAVAQVKEMAGGLPTETFVLAGHPSQRQQGHVVRLLGAADKAAHVVDYCRNDAMRIDDRCLFQRYG